MNKISRFTYTVLVMLVTAGLMTAGFAYGFSKASANKFNVESAEIQRKKELENDIKEEVQVNAPVQNNPTENIPIVNDIEVTYINYYTKCNHTVVSKINIFGTTIEDLKKKLQEDNETKGYKLVGETKDTLTYKKSLNQYCPDHYLVILEEDEVVIYMTASEGVKVEYQTLTTPVSKINEELLEKLKEGIKIDSRNDLYALLEEIES